MIIVISDITITRYDITRDLLHPVSAQGTSEGWSPSRTARSRTHRLDQLLSDQVQDECKAHEWSWSVHVLTAALTGNTVPTRLTENHVTTRSSSNVQQTWWRSNILLEMDTFTTMTTRLTCNLKLSSFFIEDWQTQLITMAFVQVHNTTMYIHTYSTIHIINNHVMHHNFTLCQ